MSSGTVFEFLKESVDPILLNEAPDFSIPKSEIIDLINVDTNQFTFEQAEAGVATIWRPKSAPVISIADRWVYASGSANLGKGRIYFKKITGSMEIPEDEVDRMMANPSIGIIKKMLSNHQKDIAIVLQDEFESMAIRNLNYTAAGDYYDKNFRGIFAISSAGTIEDPTSLEGGTIKDLSAVILTGNQRTLNNVNTILEAIFPNLVKIDRINNKRMPYRQKYLCVDPITYEVLNSSSDKLNATSEQYDTLSYLERFRTRGIIVKQSVYADTTYAYANNDTADMFLFMDPEEHTMHLVAPPGGMTWDADWEKLSNKEGRERVITYAKNKKLEVGFECKAWGIRDTAGTYTFYKKVYWFKLKPLYST